MATRASVCVAGRAGHGETVGRAPGAAAMSAAHAATQQGGSTQADVPMMAAPMMAAPARRRGCRAGRRKRRGSVRAAYERECPVPPCSSASHAGGHAPQVTVPPPPPPPPAPPVSSSPSKLSALAQTFAPRNRSSVACGPMVPKASRREERYARERAQYDRDLRYKRDRDRDMRDRSPYSPRVHAPLGIVPARSLDGMARYEERRTKLYYRNLRAEGFEVSDSDEESGEVHSSD